MLMTAADVISDNEAVNCILFRHQRNAGNVSY